MGRNPVQKPNLRSGLPTIGKPIVAASPVQVSTPPVIIIGTGRRHKGGFRLSDR
jgi:hypothetical protein